MELFTREFSIRVAEKAEQDGEDIVIELAMASETPVERWYGTEVLRVNKDSVRLGRLNDGANLLFNHDWNDLRGVHSKGETRIDADNVLRGKVRVEGVTAKGKDTVALVRGGHLTKSSVGYMIHRVIEKRKDSAGREVCRELPGQLFSRSIARCQAAGELTHRALTREIDKSVPREAAVRDDNYPTYEVIDFEPYENSLVTVPADTSVGVDRAVHLTIVNNSAKPAATERKANMADGNDAAAGESADKKVTAVEAEKERRAAIVAMCKANKIDSRVEQRWIEEGATLPTVATEILNVMEERGKAKPTTASELGLSRKETGQYSIFRAIRALKFPADPKVRAAAAFEIECSEGVAKRLGREMMSSILVPGEVLTRAMPQEAMQRAMATTPGSKGGYIVNVENMGFIDILRNRSVSKALGARVLSGLEGNVTFGRQTGKPSVTWQGGEGTSVTAADQALGQLSMTPKTAIVITDVSEQLLRQSNPSAESFVMADLAADIAIDGVDYAVINGTGGAQPLGIKNTTGITSGQSASSFTYAKALAFPVAAGAVNAIRGNPGWVTNIAGASIAMQRQRFSSTDSPLWEGNLMDGSLVGFRAMASEQLASGNIIFGSWDELVIGEWGVLELSTDTGGTRFNTAQVGIRAMWMVDVMLRYPQAFVVGTDLS